MSTDFRPDSAFAPTERRIDVTCQRFPAFPRSPALLVRLIKRIHRHVHDAANSVLRRYGLNHTDYNILMMIYGSAGDGISPGELGLAAGEKGANLTRICNALHDKGLIKRIPSAEDRRKLTLTLTGEGVALIERFLPEMSRLLEAQTQGLDATDMAQAETWLRRLLDNAEHVAATAARKESEGDVP